MCANLVQASVYAAAFFLLFGLVFLNLGDLTSKIQKILPVFFCFFLLAQSVSKIDRSCHFCGFLRTGGGGCGHCTAEEGKDPLESLGIIACMLKFRANAIGQKCTNGRKTRF